MEFQPETNKGNLFEPKSAMDFEDFKKIIDNELEKTLHALEGSSEEKLEELWTAFVDFVKSENRALKEKNAALSDELVRLAAEIEKGAFSQSEIKAIQEKTRNFYLLISEEIPKRNNYLMEAVKKVSIKQEEIKSKNFKHEVRVIMDRINKKLNGE